ncbi:hypothetical protein [Blastopirellula retiformator]|uniref:Uncharacterized protein n=1 Tax=Blastopirellula retiformator TaxID=2527970 RepID=A0A5C5VKH1_9BACT|nr:hypothetical protein [Blastopirellula retiformator]TWT38493.1 hypothetical protein Enr8_01850 [Blastopirellula retiformator]
MVEEQDEVRPSTELVSWTIAFQILMCVAAGFLLGMAVRFYQFQYGWNVDMFLPLALLLVPVSIVFVLYRSVFRRIRMPGSRGPLVILPLFYGLIMLLMCLGLPYSIPFMIVVSVIFAMLYRIVVLDQQWQQSLVEQDVPPRSGFTLMGLMVGFVGLSITLAIARLIVVGMS